MDARIFIGSSGENIVKNHFISAVKTENWYDSKKDGKIGELSYEVKTIRLNMKSNTFWIEESQWKKCDCVDLLFFCKLPEDVEDGVRLYLMIDHRKNFNEIVFNNKKIRTYFYNKCLLLNIINNDTTKKMFEASRSISTYRKT
jgi:hypothetical protein